MSDIDMKKLIRLAQEQMNKTDELLALISLDVSENKKQIKQLGDQVTNIAKYLKPMPED